MRQVDFEHRETGTRRTGWVERHVKLGQLVKFKGESLWWWSVVAIYPKQERDNTARVYKLKGYWAS